MLPKPDCQKQEVYVLKKETQMQLDWFEIQNLGSLGAGPTGPSLSMDPWKPEQTESDCLLYWTQSWSVTIVPHHSIVDVLTSFQTWGDYVEHPQYRMHTWERTMDWRLGMAGPGPSFP